jgi:hypothetical protein
MSPKEKAVELVGKMNYSHPEHEMYVAKECATICVDEMISAFEQLSISESGSIHIDFGHGYWRQVKTEIQNL